MLAGKVDDFYSSPYNCHVYLRSFMLHSYATHSRCHTCTRYTHSHHDTRVYPVTHMYVAISERSHERKCFRSEMIRSNREIRQESERISLRRISFSFTSYRKQTTIVLSNNQHKYSTTHQVFLYSYVVEVYLLRPEVTSCYYFHMP